LLERSKLQQRYEAAHSDSIARGCGLLFEELEKACATSVAVFNCSVIRLFREVATECEVFETYYKLERLRLRFEAPGDPDWQKRRPQAEFELLGSDEHKEQLHYAALSIDGLGVQNYGSCSIELRDGMIGHRATCFEGNSALIYHKEKRFDDVLRSSWTERSKLCAAKLGPCLTSSTKLTQFSKLLLRNGPDSLTDDFVEVHIFGSITPRTCKAVVLKSSGTKSVPKSYVKALTEKLVANGVKVTT
jgi:hypothetical protein